MNLPDYLLGAFLDGGGSIPPRNLVFGKNESLETGRTLIVIKAEGNKD